jgi:hypothetical protein
LSSVDFRNRRRLGEEVAKLCTRRGNEAREEGCEEGKEGLKGENFGNKLKGEQRERTHRRFGNGADASNCNYNSSTSAVIVKARTEFRKKRKRNRTGDGKRPTVPNVQVRSISNSSVRIESFAYKEMKGKG